MPATVTAPCDESGVSPEERQRKARYFGTYSKFSRGLSSHDRARINGSAKPDWEGKRTFALQVKEDAPAFRSEPADEVVATLDEMAEQDGAMRKIALWLNDRTDCLKPLVAIQQLGIAISRIIAAKNPRLEATLIELALGRSLHVNANGYAIARHYGLKPQTVHEMLADTCRALGAPKPLSKANTARYSKTQYRHHVERPSPKS